LSFTAVFARDHEPDEPIASGLTGLVKVAADKIGLGPESGDPAREPPIEAAISWLRYFTYPLYRSGEIRVFEPPKVLLVFSGSSLAYDSSAGLVCVMTGCEVTYEAWFPNGSPRIVEVALEFAEVVQRGDSVKFHSRDRMTIAGGVSALAMKVNDDDRPTSDPFKTSGRVIG
jgi:hypothetical protein